MMMTMLTDNNNATTDSVQPTPRAWLDGLVMTQVLELKIAILSVYVFTS